LFNFDFLESYLIKRFEKKKINKRKKSNKYRKMCINILKIFLSIVLISEVINANPLSGLNQPNNLDDIDSTSSRQKLESSKFEYNNIQNKETRSYLLKIKIIHNLFELVKNMDSYFYEELNEHDINDDVKKRSYYLFDRMAPTSLIGRSRNVEKKMFASGLQGVWG
jgi:hypothetical protein